MIKKILYYFLIIIGFIFAFINGDKINILAYSNIESSLGSYPVKLDIDNYNNDNLICLNNISTTTYEGITYNVNNGIITINGTTTSNFVLKFNLCSQLSLNGNYSSTLYEEGTKNNSWGIVLEFTNLERSADFGFNDQYYNGTSNNLYMGFDTGFSYENYIIKPMLVEGNNIPNNFSTPLIFGYNVHYSVVLTNSSSNTVSAGISINNNNNTLYSTTCSVPASSTGTICSNSNDPLYLPFNIDNNGIVSFNYNLNLFVGPVSSIGLKPNDSGLAFQPVFNAYYKGNKTDNLYFKSTYVFNNLFLSGFNVSVDNSILSSVTFARNEFDSSYTFNSNSDFNIASDKRIDTGYYNYINYTDYINTSINKLYYFVITTATSDAYTSNQRNYNISFSNISLRVIGDTGNVAPLPDNNSTNNKYNECSSWYDIPCQLGNALTFVIYEAPIISPIVEFIMNFVDSISYVVTYIKWFEGFGIIFSLFIFIFLIRILIMTVKGSNDDRGSK